MRKALAVLTTMVSVVILSACNNQKYDIVTSLYPQYDMVRTIVGDKDLTYTLLLPPGVEAHGFEPTPKQTGLIQSSKLFIYTSKELELWAINTTNKGKVVDLEVLTEETHEAAHGTEEHDHEDEHDHDHAETHDVHYWVSLHQQIHMVEAILPLIIELDSKNEAYYTENANQLISDIQALRASFNTLENKERPIYFIGHNVFSSLNEEYGLNIQSLTDSFSPDSDPTIEQIGSMIDAIKASESSFVYFDPFENDALAKTIKSDLKSKYGIDIELRPLESMHNVSKEQYKAKTSLLELWQINYNNIVLELHKEA